MSNIGKVRICVHRTVRDTFVFGMVPDGRDSGRLGRRLGASAGRGVHPHTATSALDPDEGVAVQRAPTGTQLLRLRVPPTGGQDEQSFPTGQGDPGHLPPHVCSSPPGLPLLSRHHSHPSQTGHHF